MFINERPRPRKIAFNVAVLGRIPQKYSHLIPIIEADIGRKEAGYAGELRLDSYLKNYLPEKDFYIFRGIRLANENVAHFQIDSLILSPTYFPIIEVKNMAGNLDFDSDADQPIQNDEVGYEDPLLQAQFQARELNKWLTRHNFPPIPIEYLIMMANKSCVLKIKKGSLAQYRVCRGRSVIFRLEEFTKKHKEVVYTPEMLRKLCRLLLKKNVEPSYDIEKIYKIPRSEVPPGVHCPTCNCLGMKYRRGSWHCPGCGCKSKDAHLKALKDYYLIFGPEITNQQFREFLGLDSADIAQKMLKKLNLPWTGNNRYRIYRISYDKLSSV